MWGKPQTILILGAGPLGARVIEEIGSVAHARYVVAGVVDDCRPAPGSMAARWLGPCTWLARIVQQVRPDRIIVAMADQRRRLPLQPLLESRARGVVVEDARDFCERLSGKIAIETIRPSVLILSNGFRNHGAVEIAARMFSVVVAAVGLVLLAPLLLMIAVAVKLDSEGPIFFVQPRAGKNGRPFGLIKLRTMRACSRPRSEWALDNADRITRVGRYLRRYRLDEVPQLVNVLRGDMNLVGPRPHPVSNHALFMDRIAYYHLRSTVRPGVTGWAQVRYGYANNLDEETEKMRYDLYYIKNHTLWLDAWILLRTIGMVCSGRGADDARQPAPVREAIVWSAARATPRPVTYAAWVSRSTSARPSMGQR
jgi:exopolysaccharide biosynthesis polyprenyl glycosylphosphotransferase